MKKNVSPRGAFARTLPPSRWFATLLATTTLLAVPISDFAQDQIALTLEKASDQVQVSWPSSFVHPELGTVYPEFRLETSVDLQHWTPVGGTIQALSSRPQPRLQLSLNTTAGTSFFRLASNPVDSSVQQTGSGGAEVFGYAARLGEELEKVGWLSTEAFAATAPQPQYLARITWDPTTANYWNRFTNTNLGLPLNENELSAFSTNGFVVTPRWSRGLWGGGEFGRLYDVLYSAELPPFVTADSVLHAWHRSYVEMLAEIECLQLSKLLETTLTNMHRTLPRFYQEYGSGPLANSLLDADYYLTVALSLWASNQVANALPGADQKARVTATLSDVAALQLKETCLFGAPRMVDFSQFTVRGYYTANEVLQRYFRAMMWCGRTELRLATVEPSKEDNIRQLGTAIVLYDLLKRSGQFENWRKIDEVIQAFVGVTDSMTFAQLGQLLEPEHILSLADVPDLTTLTNLQTRLLSGELGAQQYNSDVGFSPLSSQQYKLPRSFTVLGQKFILDGWAHAQVVFDRVLWPTNDPPRVMDNKVVRRKTSALDVAYTVLANDQVVPNLLARITNGNGMAFRDGYPYQHQLKAVRNVIDSQAPATWTVNIYTAWLAALRALSEPTVGPEYPESIRTRAWAMKTLNTQLASWTELRHDTILYAKQPYDTGGGCGYPDGYVEPRPEFWRRMAQLADVTAAAVSILNLMVRVGENQTVNLRASQLAFLTNFAARTRTLTAIAEKEVAQQPLTAAETEFLQTIVDQNAGAYGVRVPGWYPRLFYNSWYVGPVLKVAPVVADVYTDVPDRTAGDAGGVLHEATGWANMLVIAIDSGPDRAVYAGPVASHYEFYEPGTHRLTDAEWQDRLGQNSEPAPPEWTTGWLIRSP